MGACPISSIWAVYCTRTTDYINRGGHAQTKDYSATDTQNGSSPVRWRTDGVDLRNSPPVCDRSSGNHIWRRTDAANVQLWRLFYVPGLITSLVMFFRVIFGAPKRFTLESLDDTELKQAGSVRTYHGVKLS